MEVDEKYRVAIESKNPSTSTSPIHIFSGSLTTFLFVFFATYSFTAENTSSHFCAPPIFLHRFHKFKQQTACSGYCELTLAPLGGQVCIFKGLK